MNRFLCVVLGVSVLGQICSCSISDADVANQGSLTDSMSLGVTRGNDPSWVLTENDIEAYIRFKSLVMEDESLNVISIVPFPSGEQPSMYAINFSTGWEMLSSYKCLPPVIAAGDGLFDDETINDNLIAWLNCVSEEILVLEATNCKVDNSDHYIEFWNRITATSLIKRPFNQTRSVPDTLDHPVPGHYELQDVDEEEVIIENINHLIHTKWGQQYPFNQYCPIDRNFNNFHCAAGCVAVAGSQIIYFNHFENDACSSIYGSASCDTYEYPDTDYSLMLQWNKSSSIWNKFHGSESDSLDVIAIMIANIGKELEAIYSYTETLMPYMSLIDYFEDECGFESYGHSYDVDILLDQLHYNYPVIVTASSSPSQPLKHTFIVDGYKKSRLNHGYTYIFVPDDPNLLPEMFEAVYHYEVGPEIEYVRMNWGNTGSGDDVWCVLDGDWTVGGVSYNYMRDMITLYSEEEEDEEPQASLVIL